MAYHQPFQVTGFHSCDKKVGVQVLNGELELTPSNNAWDWLGGGVYFVVGSTIELGNCLNLLEPKAMDIVVKAHEALVELAEKSGTELPINDGPKRNLDCAVIKYVHEIAQREGSSANG